MVVKNGIRICKSAVSSIVIENNGLGIESVRLFNPNSRCYTISNSFFESKLTKNPPTTSAISRIVSQRLLGLKVVIVRKNKKANST
jgi:hypothetical protein